MWSDAQRRLVAVVGGSGVTDEAVLAMAFELGLGIGRLGFHLVCGGGCGVIEAACRGFRAAGGPGLAIGILPSARREDCNEWVDISLPTGLGPARNALVAQAGHAVVAVDGESGTLAEIALAWQYGRPIVALAASGGWAAELAGRQIDSRWPHRVLAAGSVAEALEMLADLLARRPA